MEIIPRRRFIKLSGLTGIGILPVTTNLSDWLSASLSGRLPPVNRRFTYFRAADMLSLEIELINLDLANDVLTRKVKTEPASIRVMLSPLHKAESTFKTSELKLLPAENAFADSFLANPSWLEFQVLKDGIPFSDWLNWKSAQHLRLATVSQASSMYDAPANDKKLIAAAGQSGSCFTTLEMPTGIYLSPYTGSDEIVRFNSDNQLSGAGNGKDFNALVRLINAWYRLKYNDKILDPSRYRKDPAHDPHAGQPKTMLDYTGIYLMWNNTLVSVPKGSKPAAPRFKLIGASAFGISPHYRTLPSPFDKDLLSRQFRKDRNNLEFVRTLSDRAMLTSMGAYLKLGYQTVNPHALVQKWIGEMVLGRDQYVEIQRLGYLHPFGHRMAEVEVGQRVNIGGISYIHRQRFIKKIDDRVVYRTGSDEAGETNQDKSASVLFPRKSYAENTVHSYKRCLPFSSIEITTDISEPIAFVEDELLLILNRSPVALQQITSSLDGVIASCITSQLPAMNALFAALQQYLENHNNEFPFDATSWITALVQNKTAASAADIARVFNAPITDYMSYLPFLADFRKFLDDLATANLLADLTPTLVAPLQHTAKDCYERLRTNVTEKIFSLYQSIQDQAVGTFQTAFQPFVTKLNAINGVIISTASITDFPGYCHNLTQTLQNNPQSARPVFSAATNSFFDDCSEVFHQNPAQTNALAWEYEKALSTFRQQNSSIAAFSSVDVDKAYELVLSYWPRKEDQQTGGPGEELQFDFVGTDWQGNRIKFRAPFIFIRADALEQVDQLTRNADTTLSKLQPLPSLPDGTALYAQPVTLENLRDYLASAGDKINTYLKNYQSFAKEALAKTDQELRDFARDHYNMLTAIDQYQQVQSTVAKVHAIDDSIRLHYQSAVNQALRRLDMAGQKIAFYKREATAEVNAVNEKITSLNTNFMEFGAAGISELQILKQQLDKTSSAAIDHFKETALAVFPELTVAAVQLPVLKEFSHDPTGVLVSYGEAFRQAGLERLNQSGLPDAIKGLQAVQGKGRENVEKILFDVKQYKSGVQQSVLDLRDGAKNQVTGQLAALKTWAGKSRNELTGLLQQQQVAAENLKADVKAKLANYINGTVSGFLGNAGRQLGGTINPGPVCSAVSTLANTYYTTKSEVDQFTGELTNTVTVTQQTVHNQLQDVHAFTQGGKDSIAALFKEAKIFGLDLSTIINIDAIQPAKLPNLKVTTLYDTADKSGNLFPVASKVEYEWKPDKADKVLKKTQNFRYGAKKDDDNNPPTLSIGLQSTIPFNPQQPTETISTITLTSFGIAITLGEMDLVALYFNQVKFINSMTIVGGQTRTTSKVEISIANVEFDYYLKLIEALEALLGLKGFLIDIGPRGIQLSLGIRIPTISTGPFTITNAALFGGVILPFGPNELPSVRFSFAERKNPFTLAAGIFGGRGFIALEASARGMVSFEASLEFGGYLGISLAVASGQAYLMGGIYFKGTFQNVYVEAYIVCGGALNILGIITVSVVFYLGMGYSNGTLIGRCSVTVSISLLFFSASYCLSFEKTISGSSSTLAANFNASPAMDFWVSTQAHGPYADTDEPSADAPDGPGYFFVNDLASKKGVLIEDPTLLFSHQLTAADAQLYADYFSL